VSCDGAAGNPAGRAIIGRAATNLAIGLVNVAAFFAPEVIVLGGGVMRSFALFEPTVRATLTRHGMVRPPDGIRVVPAELGPDSGVVGAAYTLFSAFE
jgi:glucokinase